MIKLRLVGSSADLHHLVYSNKKTGKKGSHLVAIDDKLFDVLEDVVRRRKRGERDAREEARAAAPRVESKLAPKDVQRMLRAGRSPEQVAKTAQVPLAWVEQFLTPILYEQQGVVQEVQRAWLEKQRLGGSGAPLGEAVEMNLRSRHVRLSDTEFADAWSAHRAEGQPWMVTLRFRFRGREQKATWKYDPARRDVTPSNRLAADLGWVAHGLKPIPARRAAAVEAVRSSRARAAKGKKTATKKTAAKKRPAAKKRTATKRPAAKKRTAATKRPAAKKRTTRRPAARTRRTPARRARRR